MDTKQLKIGDTIKCVPDSDTILDSACEKCCMNQFWENGGTCPFVCTAEERDDHQNVHFEIN